MDASLLLSLGERAPALAAPSAMRPDAWRLGERVDAWARGRGLVLGDPDTSPLGRARCERLAARLFPAADAASVELFARWLTWTFALDDALGEASGSATSVHAVYDDLLRAVRRGQAGSGARPLESALVELWRATSGRMTRDWRRRFLSHLEEHREGCSQQAVHRRTRHMPDPEAYPELRRRAAAPFLFDLVEPVLGVELPHRLLALPAWQAMREDITDLITWSNDIASYPRESAAGDPHNHVSVLASAYGLDPAESAAMVADRIAIRADQVRFASRALVRTIARLGLTEGELDAAHQVLRVLLDAPRAHIDWLAESGRYSAEGGTPSGGDSSRLDGLASLRWSGHSAV
ncbi:terpene synthase family protein [Actinomadura sp. NBRC 104412]|uniref:terpene synthase family protein n=1 Tax=Actinomadura sp. NBRC 104412 TaxID=3032203 RepID=UPI00255381E4|nr:terpene synthase family protein [Actinomadura sp. NBRC 104412]